MIFICKGNIAKKIKKNIIMANVKFTQQPKQRFPGDRKWKNEDAPKTDNKRSKGQ